MNLCLAEFLAVFPQLKLVTNGNLLFLYLGLNRRKTKGE